MDHHSTKINFSATNGTQFVCLLLLYEWIHDDYENKAQCVVDDHDPHDPPNIIVCKARAITISLGDL